MKQERIEWAWEQYVYQLEQSEWLRDDSLPHLDVFTGTEIFAEAFGCAIYRPEDNMPFALPRVHSAREATRLTIPKLESSPLTLLFEIADELRRRAGKGALFKLVDIQSPMDIAALIWDKNDFYVAMIQEPEAVKELAQKVQTLLIEFLDEWFRRYGGDFIAHYPAYYMPQGITLSEDEVGAVNEAMFCEFFEPDLITLSEHYGGIGIHCCAHAQHQWRRFRVLPGLRLLNLVQPPEVLQRAYTYFAPHTAQMHSWSGHGEPWNWPSQYPADSRVVIQTHARTQEQALELSDALWQACRR